MASGVVPGTGPVGRQGFGARGAAGAPKAPAPRAKVTAPKVAAPQPWLSTKPLTLSQMQAEAASQANAAVQPDITGLFGEQANQDAQNKAYQAALTGFYSALAPTIAGIQGHVSDAYNSAAGAMGQVAQGYSGALGQEAQANADATTAALQRAGQTQAIPGAQARANPGAALTDAFAATHGGIDAGTFAQQGAAKASEAAQMPAIFANEGSQALQSAISKAVAGDQQYATQIAKVYAQVPQLRATILTQVQDAELKRQQLQDSEQALGLKTASTKATIADKNASLKLAINKAQAEVQHWNAQLQNQALDRQQRATLQAQRLAAQKNLAQLRSSLKTKTGSSGKDPSPTIQKEVTYLWQHRPVASTDVMGNKTYSTPSYASTYKTIWRSYAVPYLNTLTGAKRRTETKRLDGVIRSAMAQVGWATTTPSTFAPTP